MSTTTEKNGVCHTVVRSHTVCSNLVLAYSILLSKRPLVPFLLRMRMMTIPTSPAACIPQLDSMNRDSANPTQGRRRRRKQRDRQARATETPEYREARLARRIERYRERRAEETLLSSVKLGFADKEKLTEEGGHRYGAKKQLNSVKLGLPYGDNRTERAGHNSVEKLPSSGVGSCSSKGVRWNKM